MTVFLKPQNHIPDVLLIVEYEFQDYDHVIKTCEHCGDENFVAVKNPDAPIRVGWQWLPGEYDPEHLNVGYAHFKILQVIKYYPKTERDSNLE